MKIFNRISGESGFVPILAILLLIGVILAVILSFVFGIDQAYKEKFDQSIFNEESKASKISEKIGDIQERLKQKKDQILSQGAADPAAAKPSASPVISPTPK